MKRYTITNVRTKTTSKIRRFFKNGFNSRITAIATINPNMMAKDDKSVYNHVFMNRWYFTRPFSTNIPKAEPDMRRRPNLESAFITNHRSKGFRPLPQVA